MTHAERRGRALEALSADIDGLVVTTLVNVRYLTGFTGSNGALVLPRDGAPTLLTDGRYRDQAAAECPGLGVELTRDLAATAAALLRGTWAVETHTLSVDAHARLADQTTGATVVSAGRLVEGLRVVKDDLEIEALRQACSISVAALEELLAGPLVGRSEREVARDLENRMIALGAEAVGFDTILASGPNTAIPHHSPTERVLETGDLLKIDFGARVAGYHADCTRTVVLGRADDFQREIHEVVRVAQRAGVEALTDGAELAASWDAATRVLDDAGWLDHFTTGLAHGVGLQIHEDPYPSRQAAGRLASRTVLTMEPGIYVPGRGGVRIEDTVLVTTGAPDVLTTTTTDLLEIG